MTLFKNVNGVDVEMSPEEEAEILAEWAANASRPPPVPEEISDRQFFHGLAIRGAISEDEALAAMEGHIPAAMDALIDLLPQDMRFAARMHIRGTVTFRRSHPLTPMIGQLYGWNEGQIDDAWREFAALD